MTNFPFGFGTGGNDPNGDPNDPNDMASQMPLFAELQKLLSWSGGPVNWDLAKQVAVSTLAGSGSSSVVSPADRMAVPEAIRLADLWLDDATDFPSGVTSIESWTRTPVARPHAARLVGAVRAGRRPGGRGHVQRDPRGAAQGASAAATRSPG